MVSVPISVPIVVKGFSKEDVRDRVWKLPDNMKRKIIKHICQTVLSLEKLDTKIIGEDVIDAVRDIADAKLSNLAPNDLDNSYVEIEEEAELDSLVPDPDDGCISLCGMFFEEDELLII
jgi:hypothetical protein